MQTMWRLTPLWTATSSSASVLWSWVAQGVAPLASASEANTELLQTGNGFLVPKTAIHPNAQSEYDVSIDVLTKVLMPMYMTLRAMGRRFKRKGFGQGSLSQYLIGIIRTT